MESRLSNQVAALPIPVVDSQHHEMTHNSGDFGDRRTLDVFQCGLQIKFRAL